jgi:hypothetical protein
MSLRAASSLGKCPFVFIALRSCRFNASIAFVRVHDSTQLRRKREERRHVLPRVQPCLRDHREARSPLVVEGLERGLGGVRVDGGVDRLQVARDLLPLPPRHVLEAVPDQMHHTRLHDRVRGKIASIASGKPFSPSTQQSRMSETPRCLSSLRTCIQNFAPPRSPGTTSRARPARPRPSPRARGSRRVAAPSRPRGP